LNHRFPFYEGKGFARKPGGGPPRGNNGYNYRISRHTEGNKEFWMKKQDLKPPGTRRISGQAVRLLTTRKSLHTTACYGRRITQNSIGFNR